MSILAERIGWPKRPTRQIEVAVFMEGELTVLTLLCGPESACESKNTC